MTKEERLRRLAACDLTPGRFVGRTALRREAERSNLALTRLEFNLGLATDEALKRAHVHRRLEQLQETYGLTGMAATSRELLVMARKHNSRMRRLGLALIPEKEIQALKYDADIAGLLSATGSPKRFEKRLRAMSGKAETKRMWCSACKRWL